MTVSGLGGDDTETKTGLITVYENVSTQFNGIPTSGIAPLTVDFTNQTSGDFTSQSWSFGDGGTSDLLNPSHVYMTGGTYDVSLTAIGPGGTDTETKTNYITVYTPVVAGFAASPTSGVGPLQVAFTNQSTGSFTELSWDFGDGNTGSEVNPVHTYTEDGVYTVTLTASGPGGTDIETYTDYITVYQAVNAEFSADLTSGIAPLEVHFTNLSTGDYTTSSWDFGDGGTSTDANPTHVYSAGGSFTVTLTVSGNGGTDQEIKTTYISVYSPVIADFTYTPVNGIAPLTVQFTNTSSGDYDTLAWNFGDGSPTSNEVNPAHVFEAGGTYTISLTASGAGGQGIQTHSVEVFAPVEAAFSSNVTSGVAPLNVEFTNESIGDFDTVLWDFGDLNSSNLPNPIHTYETPGIYTVMLTVSGSGGNDAEIKTDYIVVYEAAIADFSADTFSGIAPYTISFTDQSVGDYDTWWWDFGDGNTGVEASPQHQYISPGIYTVSLTVSGNGGSNTETKTDYITIYEPITVDFSAEPISGVAPTTVAFSSNITGDYNSVGWDFGDGGTSEEVNPTYEYTTPGVYSVTLTATGAGGSDFETKMDYITVYAPVVADFTASSTSGIAPFEVTFLNQSTGSYTELLWNFGDGNTSSDTDPVHIYANKGIYTVTLTASGPGGTDVETKTDYIIIYEEVVADFNADETSGIYPFTVNFSNLTTGDYTALAWDFGDGGTSTDANPVHIYNDSGNFTVTLTASGDGGTDQEEKIGYITVYTPVSILDFTANQNTGIAPLEVTFTASIMGDYDAVVWDFGDDNTSTELTPTHIYLNQGTYTVSLTATGNGGSDSNIKTNYITVYPLNRFIYLPLIIR